MKIAIIGAGRVGTTLGRGLGNAGHDVVYGVRDPSDPKHPSPSATVREAVERSEVVILATPWDGTQAALEAAGDFGNRPLLDATNPIGPGFVLTHGHTDSGGEQVARWARNARVVKVFHTTGRENLADPVYGAARAVMFACGDDDDACATAVALAGALGFEALRAGKLEQARILEPLAVLWIRLATVLGQGRNMAFGLLRRPAT